MVTSLMSTLVRDATAKTELFPMSDVEATLREGMEDLVAARASITGGSGGGTAGACSAIAIDSLSVVEVLCIIDEIVGVEVPQKVVRAGGYASVDAAIEHLLPGIEKCWSKRKRGK